ncbi:glutamyl-tRNA reductase [Gemmatimonas groenlandica]|uniref:Glutamyl-tRNA reductase n=1 Tax=Gemmatimonas groenlandica TaxID=2732249 RepID=A0A6M4ILP8_9BACT|nr:glutamyl-tRNA reductase [Gemmatimonas groenlandica]QJR35623.1 glutamyl-tRNA reductase [Gemmatimonas groenlandica]
MLISIAIDFRQADVATRELFHLSEERLTQLYRTARSEIVTEAALISTCNRTELYAWVDSDDPKVVDRAVQTLARRWMRTRGEGDKLLLTATRRIGEEAARHVVRIAAGLESQVLGDGQILGQLKAAYKRASRGHSAGPVLHRLFETALRAGKRVQTETSLTAGRNSVGAEAAITANQRFGNLENARCLLVGAGKTGARAAKQLHKLGARDIVIVNRTFETAKDLSKFVGGRAAPFETRHVEAAMADVVIVATGSEVPVITAGGLSQAREACAASGYALLLMDLSLPRNIDPRVTEQAGITLVDLDTLHQPILTAETMRRDAVPVANGICEDEIGSFMQWVANMPARDAIKPLREALEDVARREVAFASKDAGVAERTASRIVAKLLAGPMAALRRAVQRGEPLDAQAMMLLEMFSPNSAPEPRAIRAPRAAAPKPVVEQTAAQLLPQVAPRERRPSMVLSPEQFT